MDILKITLIANSEPVLELQKDENLLEDEYSPPKSGIYALVKLESLSDRMAVEEFIEQLKK